MLRPVSVFERLDGVFEEVVFAHDPPMGHCAIPANLRDVSGAGLEHSPR
jgi:hypothetical protein